MREMTPDELEAAGLPRDFHSRPVQPPPSETKLKEAINQLEKMAYREGEIGRPPKVRGTGRIREPIIEHAPTAFRVAQDETTAARSSLESLYRDLVGKLEAAEKHVEILREVNASETESRERFKDAAEYWQGEVSEARQRRDEAARHTRIAEAEFSALRSLQLTPEEAQMLVINIGSLGVSHPRFQIASRTILEKLRRISSKATSEEL